jgi:signal transduction histidine kinase
VLAQSELTRDAEVAGVRIELPTEADSPVPIWADPVQLRVVISNLLRNSLEAVTDGGQIVIRCETAASDGIECAKLIVSDNGSGLSVQDREHLFDPFYSGRQAGRGLGFGLCKCWRIVTLHSGQIDVSSAPGEQTTFTVVWPASLPCD